MPTPAQQLVLATWLVAGLVLTGLGLLERRIFGPGLDDARGLWSSFWTGWALLLAGLQVWHLFAAVDDRARVVFAAAGVFGWLCAGSAPWRAIGRTLPFSALPGLLTAGFALLLSNQSLAGPRFGDTGMYFVPSIHWIESFAIVPGLANLFVPLGHNLSYFLYAALLDGGPLHGRLYHVTNSLLALALVARGLFACTNLLFGRGTRLAADLFHAVALVPVADLVFGLFLTSPSPDAAVFLFGIVLAGELVELVTSPRPARADVVRLAFLCAVALTIKLSVAGLALAIAAIALLHWIFRCGRSPRKAFGAALLCLLASLLPVATWLLRNVVSSGFPLYPAPLLPLDVDWIMRRDAVAWIQGPMSMAPLSTIFTDPAWWKLRLDSLGWTGEDVTRPAMLITIGLALVLLLRPIAWWRGAARPAPLLLALAPVAAFAFCFINTPMPRYQGATMWILGIDLVVIALAGALSGRLAVPLRLTVVAAALFGASLPLQRGASAWLPLRDFESTSPPRLHEETLPSGLVVRVPENQVCWDAPLPCTPEPHPGLRLREPGNLAAGFAIDPR